MQYLGYNMPRPTDPSVPTLAQAKEQADRDERYRHLLWMKRSSEGQLRVAFKRRRETVEEVDIATPSAALRRIKKEMEALRAKGVSPALLKEGT